MHLLRRRVNRIEVHSENLKSLQGILKSFDFHYYLFTNKNLFNKPVLKQRSNKIRIQTNKSQPVGNKTVVFILNAVIEPKVLIESIDLLHIIIAQIEFEHFSVLLEMLLQSHATSYNMFQTHVPVQENLSFTLVVLFGQINDNLFLEQVELLEFFRKRYLLIFTNMNRCICRNR